MSWSNFQCAMPVKKWDDPLEQNDVELGNIIVGVLDQCQTQLCGGYWLQRHENVLLEMLLPCFHRRSNDCIRSVTLAGLYDIMIMHVSERNLSYGPFFF